MKHIKTSKGVINLDKKWCHLKIKQREKIKSLVKKELLLFYSNNLRTPTSIDKDLILDNVYDVIRNELQIYIPYNEYKKHVISIKI